MVRFFRFPLILLAAVALSGLAACTVTDGDILRTGSETGSIRISANVDSAAIFLDGIDTGRQTSGAAPVVLESVPVGTRIVRVTREGFRSLQDSVAVVVSSGAPAEVAFQLEAIAQVGAIAIDTRPDSALILIDGVPRGTSPYSPLTVAGLEPRAYTVAIHKAGHAPVTRTVTVLADDTVSVTNSLQPIRSVAVEHFSNTSCQPCVEADITIERVLDELGPAAVVSVGYHPNFPGIDDPMYLAAQAGNDARIQYYSVPGAPAIYIDGLTGFGAFNLETRLRTEIANRQAVTPVALVDIFDIDRGGGQLTGRVRVEARSALPANTVLLIAVIEKEVVYPQPPGTNGQTYFFDVFRGFHPDGNGTAIPLAAGAHRFVPFTIPIDGGWNATELEVVALLQDMNTKEILQTAWTRYPNR